MPKGIRKETGLPNGYRHGHAVSASREFNATPEYRSWLSMKSRCLKTTVHNYPQYGGAGITICEPWMSFEAFLADMGPRPAGTTLDRFPDQRGNYEPGNCRWANATEQSVNRKKSSANRSGIKGVCWDSRTQSWKVGLYRYGKRVLWTARKDLFEACCLVRSFEAKEKAPAAVTAEA